MRYIKGWGWKMAVDFLSTGNRKPSLAVLACNPRAGAAETGGSLRLAAQQKGLQARVKDPASKK